MGNVEPISVIVDAVRLKGVITPPPVVGTRDDITFDISITLDDGGVIQIENAVPMGDRPMGNLRIGTIPFVVEGGRKVGDDIQWSFVENRNSVKCP